MRVISGPPRYFFLRRERNAREELANWPPDIKPMETPENQVGVAVRLFPEELGWRAELVTREADLNADADGAFLLTRQTNLGLAPEGRSGVSGVALKLMGMRVINADSKGVEYVSHLVVRVTGGMGVGAPSQPLVAPIDTLLLGEYVERDGGAGSRAQATLDLRLTPGDVTNLPQYLPDAAISRYVTHTLDETVLTPQARHSITFEVEAGRVSLYGRPEMVSLGEEIRAALWRTPGVVDIADHMLYGAELERQVEEALAERGLGAITVLYEHGLINLRGEVLDNATRHKAKDLALRIPGVRGVVNDLSVAEPAPAEPAEPPAATEGGSTAASVEAKAPAGDKALSK
ncbi:MAG TPA: BON domain-containing protein [Ktedonobacterales bacterium]|nr:BON domain-containing protein [Ktedonobacterales bacterium]